MLLKAHTGASVAIDTHINLSSSSYPHLGLVGAGRRICLQEKFDDSSMAGFSRSEEGRPSKLQNTIPLRRFTLFIAMQGIYN